MRYENRYVDIGSSFGRLAAGVMCRWCRHRPAGGLGGGERPVRFPGGVYTGDCGGKPEEGDGRVNVVTTDLIARARAGDGEAFGQLVDPHRRELQVHCYRILGSAADAEDALQETLLAAWQGLLQRILRSEEHTSELQSPCN